MSRTKVRLTGLLVLTLTFGAVSASASNAASPSTPLSSTSSSSLFSTGINRLQSIATDVGGVSPSTPLTPKEIAESIGAITRTAGGIGVIIKVLDVIIITARICPQCFLL